MSTDEPPRWATDIIDRLERIEKTIGVTRYMQSANDTLTAKEAAEMLRCDSPASMYRLAKQIGLKPYAHGKYRRGDVDNAIARASLRAQKHGRVWP